MKALCSGRFVRLAKARLFPSKQFIQGGDAGICAGLCQHHSRVERPENEACFSLSGSVACNASLTQDKKPNRFKESRRSFE